MAIRLSASVPISAGVFINDGEFCGKMFRDHKREIVGRAQAGVAVWRTRAVAVALGSLLHPHTLACKLLFWCWCC